MKDFLPWTLRDHFPRIIPPPKAAKVILPPKAFFDYVYIICCLIRVNRFLDFRSNWWPAIFPTYNCRGTDIIILLSLRVFVVCLMLLVVL